MGLTNFVKGLFHQEEVASASQLQLQAERDGLALTLPSPAYLLARQGGGEQKPSIKGGDVKKQGADVPQGDQTQTGDNQNLGAEFEQPVSTSLHDYCPPERSDWPTAMMGDSGDSTD